VFLHDAESVTRLKQTIKNLETSSKKSDNDLEVAEKFFTSEIFQKRFKTKSKKGVDSLSN
jgi:hypothetical protein